MKTNQIMNMMSIYYRSGAYKMTQGNSFHRGTTYSFHRGIVQGDTISSLTRVTEEKTKTHKGNVNGRGVPNQQKLSNLDYPPQGLYNFLFDQKSVENPKPFKSLAPVPLPPSLDLSFQALPATEGYLMKVWD